MFSDNDGVDVKNGVLCEKPQGRFIPGLVVIGRVEEHEIQVDVVLYEAPEEGHRACRLHLCLLADLQPVEVLAQCRKRHFGVFGKVDLPSSAAQRFNSNSTGAGKQIGEDGVLNAGGDHVE